MTLTLLLSSWLSAVSTYSITYPFRNISWQQQISLFHNKNDKFIHQFGTKTRINHIYKGAGTNFLYTLLYPIIMYSNMIAAKYKLNDTNYKNILYNTWLGVPLSFFISPLEISGIFPKLQNVILNNNKKSSLFTTMIRIIKNHGFPALFVGNLAIMLRCSSYIPCLLGVQPIVNEFLKSKTNNNVINLFGSAFVSAIPASIISQPADILLTYRQTDYAKVKYTNYKEIISDIYKNKGMRGFYVGLPSRYIGLSFDIALINGFFHFYKSIF